MAARHASVQVIKVTSKGSSPSAEALQLICARDSARVPAVMPCYASWRRRPRGVPSACGTPPSSAVASVEHRALRAAAML